MMKRLWGRSILFLALLFSTAVYASPFDEAIEARKQGKFIKSNQLLDAIQKDYPQRVALEKATNYYLLREYGEARRLIETVISDRSIPTAVRKRAIVYLQKVNQAQAKRAKQKHRFSGRVQFGFGKDDNPSTLPSDGVVDDITPAQNVGRPEDESYRTQSIRLYHTYAIPDVAGVLEGGKVQRRWRNNIGIEETDYADLDSQDLTQMRLQTGVEWIKARKWRNRLNLTHEKINLNGESYADFTELRWLQLWTKDAWRWGWGTDIQNRKYNDDNSGRDGQLFGVNGEASYSFAQASTLRLSAEWNQLGAEDDYRGYNALRLGLSYSYRPSNETHYFISVRAEEYDYDAIEPNYSDVRSDSVNTVSLGMNKPLTQHFRFGFRYSSNLRGSNHELHEYERNRLQGTLELRF